MDPAQILAFRLARSGLTGRTAKSLAEAATCPASDFSRDAALLALSARAEGVTRAAYDRAVDSGELVLAHAPRGAIHALAPADIALYGPALIASDEDELTAQLGAQVQRLVSETGIGARVMLDAVTAATRDALTDADALDKVALHAALRQRLPEPLLPWCKGCESHHVAPMLRRYATVEAGARLDTQRRYVLGEGSGALPDAKEAARCFLRLCGPAKPADFTEWAGVAKPHGSRMWDEIAAGLVEVPVEPAAGSGKPGKAWLLEEDLPALEKPPPAEGLRLLPPGDPYLAKPNRPFLAPDVELRKRLFRPVASPGAVLLEGQLVGLWRVKAKGKRAEVTVEALGPELPSGALEAEAERVAALRGAAGAVVVRA